VRHSAGVGEFADGWDLDLSNFFGPEQNRPSEGTDPFKAVKTEPHEMRIVTELDKFNFVVYLLSNHLVSIYFEKSYLNMHNIIPL